MRISLLARGLTPDTDQSRRRLSRRKGGGGGVRGGGRGGGSRGGGGSSGEIGGSGSGSGSGSSSTREKPVPLSCGSATGGRTTATAYGKGGGKVTTIPAGQLFAGRTEGGGTRAQVYGTRQVDRCSCEFIYSFSFGLSSERMEVVTQGC